LLEDHVALPSRDGEPASGIGLASERADYANQTVYASTDRLLSIRADRLSVEKSMAFGLKDKLPLLDGYDAPKVLRAPEDDPFTVG
jgi:hypothetical protein